MIYCNSKLQYKVTGVTPAVNYAIVGNGGDNIECGEASDQQHSPSPITVFPACPTEFPVV
jgi:hypothetical protein